MGTRWDWSRRVLLGHKLYTSFFSHTHTLSIHSAVLVYVYIVDECTAGVHSITAHQFDVVGEKS